MNETRDKEGLHGGAEGKLIFTCSGAADVGEIADRAGRQLAEEGVGAMSCLAGIGAEVGGILDAARSAPQILAIDGCDQDCAKDVLERAGLKKVKHIRVTDLDMEKGKSPATPVRVRKVVDKAKQKLIS